MNVALIAHDNKLELMVQLCIAYCGIFAPHALCAPNPTAQLISEATGLAVEKYMKVTALGTDKAYLEGIKECGLRNIFDDGVVKDISAKIAGEIE